MVVRAYDVDRTPLTDRISPWSSPWVYVYSTARRIHGSTSVYDGIPTTNDPLTVPAVHVPLDGRNLTYTYYVCTNTLPSHSRPGIHDPAALREINNGISAWHRAANLLTVRSGTSNCSADELENLSKERNLVVLDTNQERMARLCDIEFFMPGPSEGCMRHIPPEAGARRDTRHLILHKLTNYLNTAKGCTSMFRLGMHEAGHAVGFGHGFVMPSSDYSVMWMPDDSLCALTVHDLLAVRALYESGYYTRQYRN